MKDLFVDFLTKKIFLERTEGDKMDTFFTALRVIYGGIVFAFFVLVPLKSRFRYSNTVTYLLAALLILVSAGIVILFLSHALFLSKYSNFGIVLWITLALVIFHLMFKSSGLEILFLVLVVLNLYVNTVAVAKVIVNAANFGYNNFVALSVVSIGVITLYIPLLWMLLFKRYKKIIDQKITFSFFKYIWIIPALTYTVFYVKIVSDYWKRPIQAGTEDVLFIILWSVVTYVLFFVTLQVLIQAYQNVTTLEENKRIESQLRMQKEHYEKLIENIENTAKLRHDWRHHLLTIDGFLGSGDTKMLQNYLGKLIPEYTSATDKPLCENHTVDVILRHHAAKAQDNKIPFDIEAKVPAKIPIAETDLCIIFGNLVENALEACSAQSPSAQRFIDLKAEVRGKQLVISVQNSYDASIILKNSVYYSTKRKGPGVGLASVKSVVEKYCGIIHIKDENHCFNVKILMNFGEKDTGSLH